jgi:hypothetical protein
MLPLIVALAMAAPPAPTWRVRVRNEASREFKDLETKHGEKLKLAVAGWSCELVTHQADSSEEAELAVGRLTLSRFSGLISCSRPGEMGVELNMTASAGSCVTVETATAAGAEIREFASALVQKSYGALHITLSSVGQEKTPASASERYSLDGGCFRPGLPPPPLDDEPAKAKPVRPASK